MPSHASARRAAAGKLHLVAFDLLELAGDDLRSLPWIKRTKLLRETFPAGDRLRLVQTRPASRAAHDRLVALGCEGSVLKRPCSTYRPGRQTTWRKYKSSHRATATLCAHSDRDATATPTQSQSSTAGVLPPSAARGSPRCSASRSSSCTRASMPTARCARSESAPSTSRRPDDRARPTGRSSTPRSVPCDHAAPPPGARLLSLENTTDAEPSGMPACPSAASSASSRTCLVADTLVRTEYSLDAQSARPP